MHNQAICQVFEQLYRLRLSEGERWKANAYQKAIGVLQNFPREITSGSEVSHIRGIGSGIADKIDQILHTGTVADLYGDPANVGRNQEKDESLKLFCSVE